MPLRFLDTTQFSIVRNKARRRRWFSASWAILLAAVVSLVVGAGSLFSAMADVERSTTERATLNGQLRDVLGINILLTDAETGQRGYLLTGKEDYLAPYRLALRALPRGIEAALRASPPESKHRALIEKLRPLIDSKLAELRQTVDLYEQDERAEALQVVNSDVGHKYMEEIRSILSSAIGDLMTRRAAAESRVLASTKATKLWAAITVAALVLAFALASLQLRGLARSREAYEAELSSKTAILDTVVNEIPSMVAVWDRNLTYRLVNKSFERWRGKSRNEVIGKTMKEVVNKEEFDVSSPFLDRALHGEFVHFEKEYSAGGVRNLSTSYAPLINDEGEIFGVIGLAHDITDHQREKVRLQQLSETDSLTGLLNRLGFESYLQMHVEAGHGESLALIYLDLDEFKPVNDTYGHAAGDAVLRTVAERLRRSVRPTDAVARLGGDEFAIVLPNVRQSSDIERIVAKIVNEVRQPIEWEGRTLSVQTSVGTAFNVGACGGPTAFMAKADSLLYEAKAARERSGGRAAKA